jgi:hypothetical protein
MADEPRYVYWLQIVNGFGPKSKAFGLTFECAYASTAAIETVLRQHGVVNGARLDTTDDGKGGRLIRAREAFMFGVAGLITLQPYNKPCWEPEE